MLGLHMHSNTAFVFGDIRAFWARNIRFHPTLIPDMPGQVLAVTVGLAARVTRVSLFWFSGDVVCIVVNHVQGGDRVYFFLDVEGGD